MQIALTFEYKSEMLKCSDLQQTGFWMCYITRRACRVGILQRDGDAKDGGVPIYIIVQLGANPNSLNTN